MYIVFVGLLAIDRVLVLVLLWLSTDVFIGLSSFGIKCCEVLHSYLLLLLNPDW